MSLKYQNLNASNDLDYIFLRRNLVLSGSHNNAIDISLCTYPFSTCVTLYNNVYGQR